MSARSARSFVAAAAGVWLVPAVASAAEEGESFGRLVWHVINFAIFVFVLVRYGGPAIRSFFSERRRRIEAELEAARRDLAAAEAQLAEWRRRMDGLDRELGELRERVRRQAAEERERMLEQARAAVERMRRDARAAIEQEGRRARERLRTEVARLAADLARELLERHVTDADRERLVDEFVDRVERERRAASPGASG